MNWPAHVVVAVAAAIWFPARSNAQSDGHCDVPSLPRREAAPELATPGRTDDPELATPAAAPGRRLIIRSRYQVGVARGPFYAPEFPEVHAHGVVVALAGTFAVSEGWWIDVLLPGGVMSIRQPAGSYLDEFVAGNPSLGIALEQSSSSAGGATLRGSAGVEVTVPVAAPGPKGALLGSRALEAARALGAYQHGESFAPGSAAWALEAGMAVEMGRWAAALELRLPLLLRTRNLSLPDGTPTRDVGLSTEVGLSNRFRIAKWLKVGIEGHAVVSVVRLAEPARGSSRFQGSMAPDASFRLGEHLVFGLGAILPVAGPLGGATFALRLDLQGEW